MDDLGCVGFFVFVLIVLMALSSWIGGCNRSRTETMKAYYAAQQHVEDQKTLRLQMALDIYRETGIFPDLGDLSDE